MTGDSPPDLIAFLNDSVSLTAGTRPRQVLIRAITAPHVGREALSDWAPRSRRPTVDEVLASFMAAAKAHCFSVAPEPCVRLSKLSSAQDTDGRLVEIWEGTASPMQEGAFAIVGRMCFALNLVGSARGDLLIQEQGVPEIARVPGGALQPLGAPVLPFGVINHLGGRGEAKALPVLITFRHELDPLMLQEVTRVLRVWGLVLQWGGFSPARSTPWSTGFVADVSTHLKNEVVTQLEFFSGSDEAWNSLGLALASLHERLPVASVEIG